MIQQFALTLQNEKLFNISIVFLCTPFVVYTYLDSVFALLFPWSVQTAVVHIWKLHCV